MLKKCNTNLTPYQSYLLQLLAASLDFIVFPADKNLGPCIIEIAEYIRHALTDHLLDQSTYKQLSESQAEVAMAEILSKVQDFLVMYVSDICRADQKFIERSLDVKDPYAYFYLMAKVHKSPWETRPIVSYSGSLLHGLGCWLDKQLQSICRRLPSFILSLTQLLGRLNSLALDFS